MNTPNQSTPAATPSAVIPIAANPTYPWSQKLASGAPSASITQFPYPGPSVAYIQGLVATAPGVINSIIAGNDITVTPGPVVTIGVNPNPTFVTETLTGGTLNLTGGTTNTINFNSGTFNTVIWTGGGVNPPSFSTRSSGTRLVLFPEESASTVDFALGIAPATMWFSVPNSSNNFNWYAATTQIAALSGAGTFSAVAIQSKANSSTASYCPPGYLSGGTATSVTEHYLRGSSATSTGGVIALTPFGTQPFTSGSSYQVYCTITGGLTASLTVDVSLPSATGFTVTCSNAAGVGVPGVTFNWFAVGS